MIFDMVFYLWCNAMQKSQLTGVTAAHVTHQQMQLEGNTPPQAEFAIQFLRGQLCGLFAIYHSDCPLKAEIY